MRCERIDPADLALSTAEEMAAVAAAEAAVETPTAIPPSAEGILLQARHGHDDHPNDALWLVRADEGDLLGFGSVDVTHWDNPHLAFVFCNVAPAARAKGVGTRLVEAQLTEARKLGRSTLLTFTPMDGHAARFLAANGFEVGQHEAQRRLEPRNLDYPHVEELASRAAAAASEYELVRLDGPASEEMLPELTAVFEAINDAPNDDLALDPDRFPPERLRRYDAAMTARRQHVYRVLARHRRTGEWAGHTILCVDDTRPGYGVQEDTSVVRAHRGHQLGMWLKATMLLWMREEQPALTTIDTWNATTNTHMIAVNDALGCRVSALGVAMQRRV
ncbi:MAG: hypothetical protein QOI06_179 [Nocardioidaceae bacterium]|jgi:GNAT superfamily N-acetyltransferase|nr:hypothetical protein [Nocardioidaceae bacterium]